MRKAMLCVIGIAGLLCSSGCVVVAPRPPVYTYRAYEVYDGPAVVVYHEGYCGGYYHHWR